MNRYITQEIEMTNKHENMLIITETMNTEIKAINV